MEETAGGRNRRWKNGWERKTKKLSLPLSAGPHIDLEYTFVCVCVSVPVYPHGMLPAAACISDRLLSRCFTLSVFLYVLHLCSLSGKVYPLGSIWAPSPQGLCIPKAPTHRSPSGSLLYHREYPQEPLGPLRLLPTREPAWGQEGYMCVVGGGDYN